MFFIFEGKKQAFFHSIRYEQSIYMRALKGKEWKGCLIVCPVSRVVGVGATMLLDLHPNKLRYVHDRECHIGINSPIYLLPYTLDGVWDYNAGLNYFFLRELWDTEIYSCYHLFKLWVVMVIAEAIGRLWLMRSYDGVPNSRMCNLRHIHPTTSPYSSYLMLQCGLLFWLVSKKLTMEFDRNPRETRTNACDFTITTYDPCKIRNPL
jgi:hypothetical protein